MTVTYHESMSDPSGSEFVSGFAPDWLSGLWTLDDWVVELRTLVNIQHGLVIHMMDDQDRLPHYWGWCRETGYLVAAPHLPPELHHQPPVLTIPLLVQSQWAGQLMVWDNLPESRFESFIPLLALSVQLMRMATQQQRLRLERLLLLAMLHQPQGSSPQALLQGVLDLLCVNLDLDGAIGLLNDEKPIGEIKPDRPVLWHPLVHNRQVLGYLGVQASNLTTDMHEALTMLCQGLIHRLAERIAHQELALQTQELQNTLEALQTTQLQLIQSEKLAVIGQFVAGIAHEVNTPLAVVTSNNQLIQHMAQQQPALEGIKPLLSLSSQACERMKQTVKNLKSFARLDHAEEKTEVDIWQSLVDTLSILNGSIPSNIAVVREAPAEASAKVCGYGGLLNIIWMNLLVNALHAMAEVPDARLTVKCWQDAQNTWVQVQDTGYGIPPEIRHRIFDPGFTTKGPGVGTGLGLSLCLQIVQKHQGELLVQSAPGKGSRFTVKLPTAG